MKKILVAGDTHGFINHCRHLIAQAKKQECELILVVGDFGYWEHTHDGENFLDHLNMFLERDNLKLMWIDGNHENHTLLRELYTEKNEEGFIPIRERIEYVPRGTYWQWENLTLLGLGGAYSVDKAWRVPGKSWWPEEEISDQELQSTLDSARPVDIMFTHDKPRQSNPAWNRKDCLECYPNQDKISEVMLAVKPKLLMHGHLHYYYEDMVRVGDSNFCYVVGLDADSDSQNYRGYPYNRADSYRVLVLDNGTAKIA